MLGQRKHPGLDLGVAIGAQQDALARLFSKRLDGTRESPAAEPKSLLCGIDVMEVECSRVGVEPAEQACAASLLDERALRAPPPLRYRLRATTQALRRSVSAPREHRAAVLGAVVLEARLRFGPPGSLRPRFACGFKAVVPQPVPDGGETAVDGRGDLADGEVLGDEALEILSPESATRVMFGWSPFHEYEH
jgi:hypothetical protein